MKRLVALGTLGLLLTKGFTQEGASGYNNFPIVLTLQFHSFSMPFQKLGQHFKNIGIGIGTEVGFKDNDQTLVQAVQLVWHRNKTMGNGIQLYTQFVYRPTISDDLFGETRIGLGYQFLLRPVDSYRFRNNAWESVGKKGRGMWMFPANIGLGAAADSDPLKTHALNYQWMILKGYNTDVPLFPQSALILNSRIHR